MASKLLLRNKNIAVMLSWFTFVTPVSGNEKKKSVLEYPL